MKASAALAPLLLATALAAANSAPAAPSVGYSIAAQPWDPLHPDADLPKTLAERADGISGPMIAAWDQARTAMTTIVPAAMAERDIGGGLRTYDVKFNVGALGPISLTQVTPTPPGAVGSLRLHWTIPATTISLKLRTPGAAPKLTDPAFSAALDLDLAIALAISNTPGSTFSVTEVRIAIPKDGFHFQGDNPVGDIAVGLTSLLSEVTTGKNLNTLLNVILDGQNFADGKQDALAQFSPDLRKIDLRGLANKELRVVNQAVSVPAAHVQIGQWLKGNGKGQMLTVLFAPSKLPLPPQTGTLTGWIRFDTQHPPAPLPGGCAPAMFSLIDATVQTGPRPVYDTAPWRFGSAPLQAVAGAAMTTGTLDANNRRCAYKLAGLVSAWPNAIEFRKRSAQGPSPYVQNPKLYWALTSQGWSSPQVPVTGGGVGAAVSLQVGGGTERDLVAVSDIVDSRAVGVIKRPESGLVRPANPGDPAAALKTPQQMSSPALAEQAAQNKQITWGAKGTRTGP